MQTEPLCILEVLNFLKPKEKAALETLYIRSFLVIIFLGAAASMYIKLLNKATQCEANMWLMEAYSKTTFK